MHDGLHADTTERIIASAVEVHRQLGPGLLEKVYESALCHELCSSGLRIQRQVAVPLFYKGQRVSEHRIDLIVQRLIVVEVKSMARIEPVHIAQVLTYLRITSIRVGLILNFNSAVMSRGIRRVIL